MTAELATRRASPRHSGLEDGTTTMSTVWSKCGSSSSVDLKLDAGRFRKESSRFRPEFQSSIDGSHEACCWKSAMTDSIWPNTPDFAWAGCPFIADPAAACTAGTRGVDGGASVDGS